MMNVKRLQSVLRLAVLSLAVPILAPVGLFAVGCEGACDEHPRFGQVENERVAEAEDDPPPELAREQPGTEGAREQAGAVGSELAAHTEAPMEQCVEIVENVMRCTSRHQFNEAVTDEDVLTRDQLSVLANMWRERGTVRQSCQQLLSVETGNPLRDADSLNKLVDMSGQQCVEFAAALRESGLAEMMGNLYNGLHPKGADHP